MTTQKDMVFDRRKKPWNNIGCSITKAADSKSILSMAGLDWNVIQKDVYTEDRFIIDGYRANVRDKDLAVLGIVTDKYQVIQNSEAFDFVDDLFGQGVEFETAGSLQGGRISWILAKMPQPYKILGDDITPYFLLVNSHDGTSGFKIAITPIRVICKNTLNLALKNAQRMWSGKHTLNLKSRISEAQEIMLHVRHYMGELDRAAEELQAKHLSGKKVMDMLNKILPDETGMTHIQKQNRAKQLEDLKMRYFDAPDLKEMGNTAYRYINAVSDFATHAEPTRKTKNYQENLFLKTISGNPTIDLAYRLAQAA